MRLNNRNQLGIGVILSYVQMALAIVIQLLYTPFAIQTLGDNEYGLLQTANSTVSMLSVLTLGFNSSYIRYYARYRQTNDEKSIYKLNGLFLILFCILGGIVLVCGLLLSNNLEVVFDKGLTQQEYATGRVLLIITTVTLALSFPRSVFSNIISAHERYAFLKIIAMIESVGGPLLNVAVLTLGLKSIAIASASLTVGIIVFALYGIYVFRALRQLFHFHSFEKGLLGSLFRFTGFIAINLIVDQINNQVDKVLLARFCGTAVVAVYSVGISFSYYYSQFSTAISGIFTPRVHQMVISTEKNLALQRKTLTAFFIKVGRMQLLLLALIVSGFIVFGKVFLQLWVGPGYEESYYVALVCMVPATVPLIQNVGIEIQRAENRHHYRSVIYGLLAVFNVIVSIYLCQIWGAVGAAIGTGAACVLGQGITMNIVYHKKINIDMLAFWKAILRQLIGMLPAFVVGALLTKFVPVRSWLSLIGYVSLYAVVYAVSVWFFSMDGSEKAIVKSIFAKLIKRRAEK